MVHLYLAIVVLGFGFGVAAAMGEDYPGMRSANDTSLPRCVPVQVQNERDYG